VEFARVHANDAIRKKNEALNLRKLAARIDGYVSCMNPFSLIV
jgi:hypothetical protein